MVSFLFWNLYKKDLLERVCRLVSTNRVDVLMLAECAIEGSVVEETLRRTVDPTFTRAIGTGGKTQLFARFPNRDMTELFEDPFGGLTIWRVDSSQFPDVLLAVARFPSRVNWDGVKQALQVTSVVREIERIEDETGLRRTILVGDLNMNPFDLGVVGAQALHAVMTRELASREERKVMGKSYRFFYNPMWGLFGDRTPGPAGTYYHRASNPSNLFWHIYDQVLLRPSLMDDLVEVKVLTNDGHSDLVTRNGLPNSTDCSDHLPILFRMNFGREVG